MPRLDFVKIYDSYHPDLRQQIKNLLPYYQNDSRLRHSVERALQKNPGVEPHHVWSVLMVRKIPAREIFHRHAARVWCYCRHDGPRVFLRKSLGNKKNHVILYHGQADDESVIVKWYQNPRKKLNSDFENNINSGVNC